MAGRVLVTGGSGFIAGYLIRELVADGWTVHATIRDLAREEAVRRLLAVDNQKVKFFAAELMSDAGWAEAMAGCSHVAHVASPFPTHMPKNENEVIVPARDGALRVLRFAKAAGVKRFVMTSAAGAISHGRPRGEYTFTEKDWTNLESLELSAYIKSKTIAERAARDWVAAEGGGLEFCSINPSVVLGPVWSSDFSPSLEVVKKLIEGSIPGCADLGFSLVDVRDVARLHVRALTAPGMAGERFICAGPFLKMIDIARILKEKLGPQAHKVPLRKLPDFLLKLKSHFDPVIKLVVSELGRVRNMDTSHARTLLGWAPRPVEETIVETARSLIEMGVVRV
jgi:dihydroflavonol-4-reductase